ncbi:MAG: Flp pilus assembly complex ATPase component TadA [Bdellovibrio sp.]|nr:Flp pilus assembly complex ATPase component TadA [Bdellovibrio sp.]
MFSEYLISKSIITETDLAEALAVQPFSKKKIGRVLVELGTLSQESCDRALCEYLNVKGEDSLFSYISDKSFLKELHIIEMGKSKGFLVSKNPVKLFLREFSDLLIEKAELVSNDFEVRILTGEQWGIFESMVAPAREAAQMASLELETPRNDVLVSTPYRDLLMSLLIKAKELDASDIHFDSTLSGLTIRFRVHGDLTEIKHIKREHAQSFLTEVKSQTGLPLTVIGSACSGAARFSEINLKVRAQSNGQIHGETIVLRLINEEKTKSASIESIGADDLFKESLKKYLNYDNGLILMCGQTGSGKSWTLYSLLMSLDRGISKVITIEDPVEYEGAGLMQIEVTAGKVSFQEALRSSLRLDPDVIMVGEIRDEETAELAFKAASTGHLVLSTLHTNGAIEALGRLKGLGIDDEMMGYIRLVSGLTLKKKLCECCRIPLTMQEAELINPESAALSFDDVQFYRRNIHGCSSPGCHNGAIGRVLIYESIESKDIQNFREGILVPDFRSLHQCAFEKAAYGEIGLEEV